MIAKKRSDCACGSVVLFGWLVYFSRNWRREGTSLLIVTFLRVALGRKTWPRALGESSLSTDQVSE
jgi:hypothetical protein